MCATQFLTMLNFACYPSMLQIRYLQVTIWISVTQIWFLGYEWVSVPEKVQLCVPPKQYPKHWRDVKGQIGPTMVDGDKRIWELWNPQPVNLNLPSVPFQMLGTSGFSLTPSANLSLSVKCCCFTGSTLEHYGKAMGCGNGAFIKNGLLHSLMTDSGLSSVHFGSSDESGREIKILLPFLRSARYLDPFLAGQSGSRIVLCQVLFMAVGAKLSGGKLWSVEPHLSSYVAS